MTPTIPSPRLRLALLGTLLAILLAAGPPEVRLAVAYLCPFLILIAFLLADHYPGEWLIAGAPERARRRRPEPNRPTAVSFAARWPRGGHLIAFALAGRAPPAPAQRLGLCSISI